MLARTARYKSRGNGPSVRMRPGPEASVNNEFMILGGTANPNLGAAIARELGTGVGACVVDRYLDGDVAVQLLETVP